MILLIDLYMLLIHVLLKNYNIFVKMEIVTQNCQYHSKQTKVYAVCIESACTKPSLGCQECFLLGHHSNHKSIVLKFFNDKKMNYVEQIFGEQYCDVYEKLKNNVMNQDEFNSLIDSLETDIVRDIDEKNMVQQ